MENGGHFYAKLLGFRKDRQDLLSVIAKKSALPLLTRLSDTDSISLKSVRKCSDMIFWHPICISL